MFTGPEVAFTNLVGGGIRFKLLSQVLIIMFFMLADHVTPHPKQITDDHHRSDALIKLSKALKYQQF